LGYQALANVVSADLFRRTPLPPGFGFN